MNQDREPISQVLAENVAVARPSDSGFRQVVFTVNGIGKKNKPSAPSTTDRMADKLEMMGFETHSLRYPLTTWRTSRNRLKQYQDATRLLDQVGQIGGDSLNLIAHSHGCLLSARMFEIGNIEFDTVILFAPALDAKWVWPRRAFKRLIVVHNPNDRAIRMARMFPAWHQWGSMGADGWEAPVPPGNDPRVSNYEDPRPKSRLKRQHSHYFRNELAHWSNFAGEHINSPAA